MTIKEIAKLAGVSPAAVSRYFNNGYVSEEKRETIRRVVEEPGYYPSMQARTRRTRRTNMIGVVIPRIDSNSIARVVEGIMEIADENDYQILLANTMNTPEKELEYLSVFHDKQVDGVILIGTLITEEHKRVFANMEVPLVIVGQKVEGYNSVYHDDYNAEYAATKLLLDKGCRKLVFLGVTEEDKAVGENRYAGYRDAVSAAGFEELADRRVVGNFNSEDGYNCMKTLYERYHDIDGVVAATDTIASGAMKFLHEKKIRIPQDIMIVGQGDSQLAKVMVPELTTMKYYYELSGKNAAKILIDNLKADGGEIPIRMVKLGYEMILRGSTELEK